MMKKFWEINMKSIPTKVVRQPELIRITGLSRSTLADLQNPKSPRFDVTFPTKVRLGVRAVGWFLEDVIDWLSSRKVVTQSGGAK